jgi:endonuclease/exonuclease/phosphatase (EEP) superfamily protein YafD
MQWTKRIAVVLALGTMGAGCSQRLAPEVPSGERPHLRVMTYNVNYGLAGDDATMDAIEAGDAEVVLLQETTPAWEAALRTRFAESHPHMQFHHCCGAGGLAILSKYPVVKEELLEPPEQAGWFPAWRLVVDSPLGQVQVLNVHLRPPVSDGGSVVSGYFSTPPIRRAQIDAYQAALEPELPTLIVGDFNESASGSAIGLLDDRGYRSALPRFQGAQDTWRWNTSVGTITSQLDHIVHDDKLVPLGVRVLGAGRSDHLPVVGDFELPAAEPVVRPEPSSGTSY